MEKVNLILDGWAPYMLSVLRVVTAFLFTMLNDGESAIFFCFIFLYLAFAGAGPWSLDALWLGYPGGG